MEAVSYQAGEKYIVPSIRSLPDSKENIINPKSGGPSKAVPVTVQFVLQHRH